MASLQPRPAMAHPVHRPSNTQPTRLLDRVRTACRLRHYSYRMEQTSARVLFRGRPEVVDPLAVLR